MVISIRRSRHEEGEELVAIWCRSVDATHDFYQQSIGPSWKSWFVPFCRKHRCGSRLMNGISRLGLCC
ncbi:putative acetyltransferase [Escherichia coli]|nr:putative acetyltransferase [Escherichia coli]